MAKKLRRAWRKKKEEEPIFFSFPGDKEVALASRLKVLGEAYRQGNLGAMLEALLLCSSPDKMFFSQAAKDPRPLPEWLTQALADLIKDRLFRKERNGRSWMDQRLQDMIDETRSETVDYARDLGIQWIHVYQAASELLAGSKAEGSPEKIKESRKRVKDRSENSPFCYMNLYAIRIDLNDVRSFPDRNTKGARKSWIGSTRSALMTKCRGPRPSHPGGVTFAISSTLR